MTHPGDLSRSGRLQAQARLSLRLTRGAVLRLCEAALQPAKGTPGRGVHTLGCSRDDSPPWLSTTSAAGDSSGGRARSSNSRHPDRPSVDFSSWHKDTATSPRPSSSSRRFPECAHQPLSFSGSPAPRGRGGSPCGPDRSRAVGSAAPASRPACEWWWCVDDRDRLARRRPALLLEPPVLARRGGFGVLLMDSSGRSSVPDACGCDREAAAGAQGVRSGECP